MCEKLFLWNDPKIFIRLEEFLCCGQVYCTIVSIEWPVAPLWLLTIIHTKQTNYPFIADVQLPMKTILLSSTSMVWTSYALKYYYSTIVLLDSIQSEIESRLPTTWPSEQCQTFWISIIFSKLSSLRHSCVFFCSPGGKYPIVW